MKLAHLADCHLGYSAYHATTTTGANQRSVDVALALRSAIDAVIEARVDAVLFAGDFFDSPKPSNTAIRFAVTQLQRLRAALPGTPVIIVSGNHDEARRADTGAILPMFADLGLADVAQNDARQFVYPQLDLRVVAVPHNAVARGEIPASEGTERFQVLLAHAEVQGVYRKGGDRPSGELPAAVLNAPWSAVMLGDYHIAHRVAPLVHYPGSLEFTSSNPWEEIGTPKGWLLWNLDAGTVEPQPIPQARAVYDLEPIDAVGLTAEQVSALISERMASVDLTGALVRLVVRDIPRHLSRQLDHAAIRRAKACALHFNLDLRAPERVVRTGPATAAVRGKALAEIVADFLGGYTLTPGVDRAAFQQLGAETFAGVERDFDVEEKKRGAA